MTAYLPNIDALIAQGAILTETKPLEDLGLQIALNLNNAKSLSKPFGGRELSLVITKLEEAQLWLTKISNYNVPQENSKG